MAVAAGGALGAVARYLLAGTMHRLIPGTFPVGSFTVNVVGGLLVGLLAGLLAAREAGVSHAWQLFLVVGVCGGFTTFSAFSLEVVRLAQAGQHQTALLSVGLEVAGAILATVTGLWIAQRMLAS